MKKIFLFLTCATVLVASAARGGAKKKKSATHSKAAAASTKGSGPKISFKDGNNFDFGNMPSGPDRSHSFTFTNTGNEPLIINNVSSSGNTCIPDWPKQPIVPGKTGTIKVTVHTNHSGPFSKEIDITSNALTVGGQKQNVVYVKGMVTGDDRSAGTKGSGH
jgi:hypothetical protein